MTDNKLDIFETLEQIDKKNTDFYSSLSEQHQKQFQPFLIARWLSGINNKQQIMLLNEFVNPYLFSLYQHKELLWDLLTICTSGRTQRYKWLKQKSKGTSCPNTIEVIKSYFGYNTKHAEHALKILSHETIIDMACELGWQDTDINKVKKELGIPTSSTRKKNTKPTDVKGGFDF